MTLKKRFLHIDITKHTPPKRDLILVALCCVLFAIVFYTFLYASREVMRLLSIDDYYNLVTMTDKEVQRSNFLLALISMIFGQSLFLLWLIRFLKPAFGRKSYLYGVAINDQRVLNLNFLNWFARLTTVYVIMLIFSSGGHNFILSKFTNPVIVLIIIALFLQSWLTIIRLFKSKGIKWMLLSALLILVCSFALSFVNIVDYDRINKIAQSHNLDYQYHTDWPQEERPENFWPGGFHRNEIYLINNTNYPDDSTVICKVYNDYYRDILIDSTFSSLDSITKWLVAQRNRRDIDRTGININRNIKMKVVKELNKRLLKAGVLWADYRLATGKNHIQPDIRYYMRYYQVDYSSTPQRTKSIDSLRSQFPNQIDLSIAGDDSVSVNGKLVGSTELCKKLYSLIVNNTNYITLLQVDDNDTFSQYLRIGIQHINAIERIREQYMYDHYNKLYAPYEQQYQDVQKLLPVRLVVIDKIN